VLHYRIRRHDGEYRWVADNGVPRHDAQGNFAGYIGSCSDITERLRAEDKFRQVFERAPNATIMVDGRGTMVLVNAQVEPLFGYQRGELIGLPIETLIPERLHREYARHRGHFMSNPHMRAMGAGGDLFGRRKDGVEVPVEVGLNPISTVDGLFVVASVTDITARRRAEAESRRLQQEVAHISRIATMGELLAAIVHELGQPMTAILANAQAGLRLTGAGREHAKEVRDILGDIVADERRANQVIARLRSLFRKGEGKRQPLTVSDLINDVVSIVRADADLRQVAIKLDVAAALPRVSGDRVQLQQVLLNVFVNAFEAMAERTDGPRELTVRACALGDERVQVDVVDTGLGIAADNVESLFEPFVTTKPGGMGMGLSVASSIVRAHDGQLWAANNPDIGATFYIVLPAMPDDTTLNSTT
jgi:two-component system sensor kinase FixL